MLVRFFSVLLVAFAFQAQATGFRANSNYRGFIEVGSKELFVDYLAPEEGRPTVILLNGLTYSTTQWDKLVKALKPMGLGVLRYDMDGMGQTLLKYGMPNKPFSYQDQVTDLNILLKKLRLKAPYNIVGLSYGGGIAAVYATTYPQKIQNVILMAPYTEALEQQDTWIKGQVALTRLQYPYNPYSDDAIYDYFLKQICYTTYPLVEPIVLENPYKLEGVFRMTQGIRKLKLKEIAKKFPKDSVTLLIGEKDQYIPREVLESFWESVPVKSQVEKIEIKGSEHKIPEAKPETAAEAIDQIVSREK